MAKLSDVTLTGASANRYEFEVYSWGTQFTKAGGVYAITRRYQKSGEVGFTHAVLHIGHTGDLSTRFENHHGISCFREHNANCACVHRDNNGRSRRSKETDLIEGYNPPCNRE